MPLLVAFARTYTHSQRSEQLRTALSPGQSESVMPAIASRYPHRPTHVNLWLGLRTCAKAEYSACTPSVDDDDAFARLVLTAKGVQ